MVGFDVTCLLTVVIIIVCTLAVVMKVPLNGRCMPGDVCLSQLAQCVRGLCRCADDYYERRGVCGRLNTCSHVSVELC